MGIKIAVCLLIVIGFILLGYTNSSGIQELTDKYAPMTDRQEDIPEVVVPAHAGTYEDPVDVGEEASFSSSITSYYVSVNEVIRGAEANDIILDGSEFNDVAPEGYEYLLVHMNVKYVSGDNSITLSSKDFKAICEGVECNYSYALFPEDFKKFSKGSIMSDGTRSGWLGYLVPQNKIVVMEFNPGSLSSDACYMVAGT